MYITRTVIKNRDRHGSGSESGHEKQQRLHVSILSQKTCSFRSVAVMRAMKGLTFVLREHGGKRIVKRMREKERKREGQGEDERFGEE